IGRIYVFRHLEIARVPIYEPVPPVNQILSAEVGELELLRQVEGLRGTRLFAEPAEYAPQHVDFVDGRVPLAGRVRILRVVFRRNHRNGVGRAGNLTQFAADTHFEPIYVAPQLVAAAKARAARLLLFRIADGRLLPEKCLERRAHPFY